MKVVVGTVFGETVDSWYHQSVVQLLYSTPPDGYSWGNNAISARSGPLLAMARAQILGNFIEHTDGDCLVLIDTDQEFTPERFWDLVRCYDQVTQDHENVGILAGITWMSGSPKLEQPLPNLFLAGPNAAYGQLVHAQTYPPNALIEVAAVGSSCLVMGREVAQTFVDQNINPYHHISILNWKQLAEDVAGWDDPEKIEQTMREAVWRADQLGEDMSFCTRVTDAGYRILCHTGLEFAHSKTYLLDGDDYRKAVADRFPDKEPDTSEFTDPE